MKVGNTINGLKITDVKRVNKLNLIQFLKEVDSYLQQGYQIDVNSARQVGLVLMADVYKTEAAFGGVGSVGDSFKEEVVTKSPELTAEAYSDVMLPVVDQNEEAAVAEQTPVAEEIAPLTAKKTTTRSKKTAQ